MEDLWSWLEGPGSAVKDTVLLLARFLTGDAAPGIVVILLLAALIVLLVLNTLSFSSRRLALAAARHEVLSAADETEFAREGQEISRRIMELDESRSNRAVARAWAEYEETIIWPDREGEFARNALRPGQFINLEDLGFSAGWWRIVSGLFVTVGLALTFLGLIAALDQVGEVMKTAEGNDLRVALTKLLTIASAKFIMSLTGIVCSIIFTVWLRRGLSVLEREARLLCEAIEKRLSFIALEHLAERQLRAQIELKDHLTKLNTQLIAQLGEPLREGLSSAVSKAIADRLGPIASGIGQAGTQNVEGMVRQLSERLSGDVGEAMQRASGRLSDAGELLGALVERMESGTGRVGAELEQAVLRMTQAAEAMTAAAEGFRNEAKAASAAASQAAAEQMNEAGSEAARQIHAAAAQTADAFAGAMKVSEEVSASMGSSVVEPLEALRAALERAVAEAGTGAERMHGFAQETNRGAEAAGQTADRLERTVGLIGEATAPLERVLQGVADAARRNAEASEAAAELVRKSSEEIASRARDALVSAEVAIGGEREAIGSALDGVRAALGEFQGLVDRHEDIDRRLGRALGVFKDEVERTLESISTSNNAIRSQHADALDTLRAVVDQAQSFVPESRRV